LILALTILCLFLFDLMLFSFIFKSQVIILRYLLLIEGFMIVAVGLWVLSGGYFYTERAFVTIRWRYTGRAEDTDYVKEEANVSDGLVLILLGLILIGLSVLF
jgi:hypothetical protein